jgi:hypothetical protein
MAKRENLLNFTFSVFVVLMLSACKPREKNAPFYFNYEQAAGWLPVQLEKGFAHSGKYCEKLTAGKIYSHTFVMPLAEMHSSPVKKINAAAWVAAPDVQNGVGLVIDLFSPSANKSIKNNLGKDFGPAIAKKGGWFHCTNELDVSAVKERDVIVKVYVWNPNGQKLFVDDLEISFE